MKAFIYTLLIFCVTNFSSLLCAGADEERVISSPATSLVIEQVLSVLESNYVYPDTARKMRDYVKENILAGKYQKVSSSKDIIKILQSDLRFVSKDGHISLHLNKDRDLSDSHVVSSSPLDLKVGVAVEKDSDGEPTIGYLRFNKFGDERVKSDIVGAMAYLNATLSLIIDLRDNDGGDPNLVAFLSSYFLANDTPLWSIYDRDGNAIIDVKSTDSKESLENKYTGRVCILTSQKTYSAAEAFAYTLKHLDRACIVGETTGGGAHLVEMQRVNDEITIRIPVARAYNPVTKSNWEGDGVIPDINVDAADAKSVALKYFQNAAN